MKTITKAIKLLAVLLLLTVAVKAQAPQKFNYQAIARNPSGADLPNQTLGIRVSILDGTPGGTVVYQETHTKTTNNYGLFTLEVGAGTVVSGDFASIGWGNGAKYVKTEIDPAGGTNYVVAGTSQLISVPYAIWAGNSNNPGPTGPQGPTGLNGANGANGAVGPTGPQGIQGPQGTTGANGATGATGAQGPVGPQGATGANGTNGIDGVTGPQGPAGANGATGAQGPAGPQGPTGANGTNGIDGATGATGPQGPVGPTGAAGTNGTNGIDGATGATGPQGLQGPAGPTGAAGTNGTNGATGATGPQGPIGPTGAAGTNGIDGATGPQGPQGLQGPIGPTGAAGTNGTNGATGATGPQGPIGPTGAAGTNGIDGATGATGPQGPIGPTGAAGTNGTNGIDGATGATGPQGPTGPTGAAGTNGVDGATGPQGPAGATGADGATGPSGADGATGATGATGFLQDGDSAGDTPYWDGTAWVTTSSNIYNNNANVGVGTDTPGGKLGVAGNVGIGTTYANSVNIPANGLLVEGQLGVNIEDPSTFDYFLANNYGSAVSRIYVDRKYDVGDFGPNYTGILSLRAGETSAANGGIDWTATGVDAAIKGYSWYGNNFSAGVYGGTFGDYANSAGVVGSVSGFVQLYGALGYNDGSINWGVYTPNDAYIGGNLQYPVGAATNYVLTSDAVGNATWQDPNSLISADTTDWNLLGNAGTDPSINFLGTTDAQDLSIRTNSTEAIRINNNQFVGIGTAAPIAKLHVVDLLGQPTIQADGDFSAVLALNNPSTGFFNALFFEVDNGLAGVIGRSTNSLFGEPSGSFLFDNSANTPEMVIDPNGLVGIGTLNPTAQLHVNGGSGSFRYTDGSEAANYVLTSDATGNATWQDPNTLVDVDSLAWALLGNAGTDPSINFVGTTDAQDLVFRTDNIERMRFNTSGQALFNTNTNGNWTIYGSDKANVYSEGSFTTYGPGVSQILGARIGTSGNTNGGTSWNADVVDAAVKGTNFWGNNYTAGVYGNSYGDYEKSAGVAGTIGGFGFVSGFLGYRDDNNLLWGVYTQNDAYVGGNFQYPVGANTNYVLTSDATGNATWQDPNSLITSAWNLSGNSGVDPTNQYVGTSDASELSIRTNGTEAIRVSLGQTVGIGTNPDASAVLDVASTTQGFLMPRMTDTERDAIASPADGLYIFNLTTGCPNYYYSGAWYSTCGTIITPPSGSQLFNYTGGVQTFTVPAGVTSIDVDILAAGGGLSAGTLDPNANLPGLGGRVQATLTVTPGQVLNVYVGGAGNLTVGGFNGGGNGGTYNDGSTIQDGGGGGGASDIRTAGNTLADRIAVAGGGGGAGYNCFSGTGSDGGNGGSPNGNDGVECNNDPTLFGGGATQVSGGTGATAYPQPSGAFGVGGSATSPGFGSGTCSGGGAGGYYGGGAGAFAGGGGGSSFVTPVGSSGITYTSGVNAGDGSVTISW